MLNDLPWPVGLGKVCLLRRQIPDTRRKVTAMEMPPWVVLA